MLYIDQYAFLISSVEFLGAVLCMIAIVMDVGHKLDADKKDARLIRWILHFTMFSLIADGISYIFDLNVFQGAILINKVILMVDFVGYLSAFFLIFLFIIAQLPAEKTKLIRGLRILVWGAIGIDYVLLALNPFTKYIYYLDKNNEYIENWGINLFTTILFLLAFVLIVVLLCEKKHMEKGTYIPMILCHGILILGGVSELMIDDFPGTNFGIGVSILFLHWIYRNKAFKKSQDVTNSRYKLFGYVPVFRNDSCYFLYIHY